MSDLVATVVISICQIHIFYNISVGSDFVSEKDSDGDQAKKNLIWFKQLLWNIFFIGFNNLITSYYSGDITY